MVAFRHYLPVATVIAAAFAAAAVLIVLWQPHTPGRTVTTMSASATFVDQEVLFADQVHARLDVIVPGHSDPSVTVSFKPYRIDSASVSSQSLPGGKLISYRYTISCLVTACKVSNGLRPFLFPPATVKTRTGTLRAGWPLLSVYTRISPAAALLGAPQPRFEQALALTPPRPHSLILWALAALSAICLGGLMLVWWPRRPQIETAPDHDPLEEALSLARHLVTAASVLRLRAALEDAANELENAGRRRLARQARELAWRRQQPSQREVERLSEEARR